MRIPKEEYREAIGYLKRYNYNKTQIDNIRNDIINISAPCIDGMPKAPYSNSDSTGRKVIELDENKDLAKARKEKYIVDLSLKLVNSECNKLFENIFREGKTKWECIDENHFTEPTYKRRKSELIYTVYKEIKKVSQN